MSPELAELTWRVAWGVAGFLGGFWAVLAYREKKGMM